MGPGLLLQCTLWLRAILRLVPGGKFSMAKKLRNTIVCICTMASFHHLIYLLVLTANTKLFCVALRSYKSICKLIVKTKLKYVIYPTI